MLLGSLTRLLVTLVVRGVIPQIPAGLYQCSAFAMPRRLFHLKCLMFHAQCMEGLRATSLLVLQIGNMSSLSNCKITLELLISKHER